MTDKITVRRAMPGGFTLAEQRRNVWFYAAESGVSPEQMTDPSFWVHVSKSLRQFDRIECQAVTGAWFVEVMVLAAKDGDVKLGLLRAINLDELAAKAEGVDLADATPDGYGFEHRDGKGWCVVRSADKEVIKDGCATMPAAKRWLTDHNKALAA